MEELTDIEDYIKHFTDDGFNLVKDATSNGARTITLRTYSADEYGEVIIKEKDSKITVLKTLNGKIVLTN